MNRRQFLTSIAAATTAIALPGPVLAQSFWESPRSLWLKRRIGKGFEEKRVVYWADGQYIPEGYREVCMILRDVKQDVAVTMDTTLVDILRGIQGWFEVAGIRKAININSGYRTAHTNARTEGAAKNSMHVAGRAVDLWLEDVPSEYIARLAIYLQGGGVGVYASRGFVHVDSGRLRTWRG